MAVIIPCYNAAPWIAETLVSVVAQGSVVAEIVLVDDGSDDGSIEVATALSIPALRIIRQSHLGASRARNAGTAATVAPLVQYLDADDVLLPGTLEARVDAIDRSGADVVYTDFVRWERQSDGRFADGSTQTRELGHRPDAEILVDAWWPPGALLYRRSLVERILPWREDLPVIQDARFLLDAALAGARFEHLPRTGLRYRIHGTQSLSRRDPRAFVNDCHHSITDVDRAWVAANAIDEVRRRALVLAYGSLARAYFPLDRARFGQVVARLLELDPHYLPDSPPLFKRLARLVGYPRAEYVAAWLRPILHRFGVAG